MNCVAEAETDQLRHELDRREERIRQLENLIDAQRRMWEADAWEWRKLQIQRRELSEWLVDQATDGFGKIVNPLVDAALAGEMFIPISLVTVIDGSKYAAELSSTVYRLEERPAHG